MLLANAGELDKYVHMLRAQTTAAMKEIISNCLIDTAEYPSKKADDFYLKVKENFDRSSIAPFLEKTTHNWKKITKKIGYQSAKLVTVLTQSHHYLLSKTLKMNKEKVSLNAGEVILPLPNFFACV